MIVTDVNQYNNNYADHVKKHNNLHMLHATQTTEQYSLSLDLTTQKYNIICQNFRFFFGKWGGGGAGKHTLKVVITIEKFKNSLNKEFWSDHYNFENDVLEYIQ